MKGENGMKEQSGGGKRHSSTRRKFLEFIGTASGLLLTSCGHGFVKPINETEDPLIIELTAQEKQLLSFVSTLLKDPALQSQFIENPVATLVQHNIVPQDSRLNISKANRLLLYLVGNTALRERLGTIVQRYPALSQIRNVMTNDQLVDARFLREVEKDLTSPDSLWKRVIEDQVYVLVSDPKVREILELKIEEDSQIREYASRLAAAISGSLSKAEVRPTAVFFYVNLNVVANANWKVNANVHYNANLNLNANANANLNYTANANFYYNVNLNTSGNSVGSRSSMVAEWTQFVDLFTKHAQEQLGL
jgi:hypothetical protein